MSDDHDSQLFKAMSCRVLLSIDRQAMAIEAVNENGLSIVIELKGDGPAKLKSEIDRCFREHPQMNQWKLPAQH